ncbi:hypothetical protein [Saprospira grandis]|uniref:Uncharacterized protein n=1 Tax=Saprospira grandis (strain Lewin) TaxID=984262 RepID=H6L158_SAPGL|nr:hypothetical protein [Saprospira grandis]AFC26094.1 hypothetical protein SGRA_3367 [Saprospira grandis str. Lewin]
MDKLISWSVILLFAYLFIRVLSETILTFIPSPLVLVNVFGANLLIIITSIISLRAYLYKNTTIVTSVLAILISLSGYGFDFLYRLNNPPAELVIYRDSVMGSVAIEFYKKSYFRIVKSSLFGEELYKGTYKMKNDAITLEGDVDSFGLCNELVLSKENAYCVENEVLIFYRLSN